jgi:hypothetical protein
MAYPFFIARVPGFSGTTFARKASTGRRIIRDNVAKGFWRLRTICCGRTSHARKQTRQSLILAVIGAIVAGAVGAFWLGFKTIFGKRSRGRWRVMRITVKPNRWPILATG